MAEISKLNLTGSDLDIKDSIARDKLTVVDPSAGEGLITFGVDANGNYGYKKVGADTVTPFKTGGGGDYTFTFNRLEKAISSWSTTAAYMKATTIAQNTEQLFTYNFNAIKDSYMVFFFLSNTTAPNIRVHYNDGYYQADKIGYMYFGIGELVAIQKLKFTEDKECTSIGIINTSNSFQLYAPQGGNMFNLSCLWLS